MLSCSTTETSESTNRLIILWKLCKKENPLKNQRVLAEREGFEPPVPLSTTVFKTVVIDHSTISPLRARRGNIVLTSLQCLNCGCKGNDFFSFHQIFLLFFFIKACFCPIFRLVCPNLRLFPLPFHTLCVILHYDLSKEF